MSAIITSSYYVALMCNKVRCTRHRMPIQQIYTKFYQRTLYSFYHKACTLSFEYLRTQGILTADVITYIRIQVLHKCLVLNYHKQVKNLQSNDMLVPLSISATTEREWTIVIKHFQLYKPPPVSGTVKKVDLVAHSSPGVLQLVALYILYTTSKDIATTTTIYTCITSLSRLNGKLNVQSLLPIRNPRRLILG